MQTLTFIVQIIYVIAMIAHASYIGYDLYIRRSIYQKNQQVMEVIVQQAMHNMEQQKNINKPTMQ